MLMFGIPAWYGICHQAYKDKLCRIMNYSRKLDMQNVKSLLEWYEKFTLKKAKSIRSDCRHPPHHCYQLLKSGKRFQLEYTRTARFNKSFVPASLRLLNYDLNNN